MSRILSITVIAALFLSGCEVPTIDAPTGSEGNSPSTAVETDVTHSDYAEEAPSDDEGEETKSDYTDEAPSDKEAEIANSDYPEETPSDKEDELALSDYSEETRSVKEATRADGNRLKLNGQNTKIEFIGTHVGNKPNPQKGSFKEFTGNIVFDSATVTSITIKINTASLHTKIAKLTNHLKSPDFFDVRQYPMASFKSTSVTMASVGKVNVKGNFTLVNVTREISFPATFEVVNGNLTLKARFKFDRTEFGMNFGLQKVKKIVSMKVTIGT